MGSSQLLPGEPSGGQTALLIWFHGLAMSGDEFGQQFEKGIARRMPWLQVHYPNAPKQAVTYLDGEIQRAWFDIEELPVSTGMEHEGLKRMTENAHAMIRQAEQNGIPASRIVLGGFSQGGALALLAGLSYERPVAGIAAFSAWLPGVPQTVCKHPATPIFMGHGTEDRAVPCQEGLATHRALRDLGFTKVGFSKYKGVPHGFVPEEFAELESFVQQELPQFSRPRPMPRRPLRFAKPEKSEKSETLEKAEKLEKSEKSDQTEAKLAEPSTDEGSGSDSPATTDDEYSGPAPLRHCASMNMKSCTSPKVTARCTSPQVKPRVLPSATSCLSTSQSTSVVHNFSSGCVSPGSSRRATMGNQRTASPAPSFLTQRGLSVSSCQVSASVTKAFSCQVPAHAGASPRMAQGATTIRNVSPSFARSSSRLQCSVNPTSLWPARLGMAY
jgi:phospholipase/carboxylesterase